MKEKQHYWEIGDRIKQKRILLGMTQEEVSAKIGRSPKYYADIERGDCGMSVETLTALSITLNMPLDYIIFGKVQSEEEYQQHTEEVAAIMNFLDTLPVRNRTYALRMLKLFLAACEQKQI